MPFSKTGKSRRGVRVPVTLGTVPSEGWPSPGPGLYKKKKNCFCPNLFNYHLFSVPLTPSPLVVLGSNVGGSLSTYPIPAPSLER